MREREGYAEDQGDGGQNTISSGVQGPEGEGTLGGPACWMEEAMLEGPVLGETFKLLFSLFHRSW